MTRIVAVCGAIASGKSELTRELASRWSCPRASFGSFVAHEAARRGQPADRDGLQRLGTELIEELGWPEFCQRALAVAGATVPTDALVIDGVRHIEAIDALRSRFAPTRVLLVHVACEPQTRIDRLVAQGWTLAEIERWDRDRTEQAQEALCALADLIVRGDRPVSGEADVVEGAL